MAKNRTTQKASKLPQLIQNVIIINVGANSLSINLHIVFTNVGISIESIYQQKKNS